MRVKPVLNWRQVIPTLVTLAAMLAGFFAILYTLQGMAPRGVWETGEYHRRAALMIMLSMILDGLDGNLARLLKGSSDFGAELDTYVDLISFGIAPALLIYAVSLQQTQVIWRILLPSAVAISGVVRLARFKVKDPLRGQGGYGGLPITANAAWVALMVFISQCPPTNRFNLSQGYVAIIFLIGIVLFVTLQVTNFRYPKPTKKAALFIPCVILVGCLFFRGPYLQHAVKGAITMIILGLGYVLVGPFFVKGHAKWKARNEDVDQPLASDQ